MDINSPATLLQECADKFRFYEGQHRLKNTPDADAKAEVNRMMAEKIEAQLEELRANPFQLLLQSLNSSAITQQEKINQLTILAQERLEASTRSLLRARNAESKLQDGAVRSVARICHQVNKALCDFMGDTSQVDFDQAPANIQASAIDGVMFHIEHPDAGDSGSHDNWLKFKKADGWKYGKVKDATAKTHPCMVPFEELPPEQQIKDALFRSVVQAALLG